MKMDNYINHNHNLLHMCTDVYALGLSYSLVLGSEDKALANELINFF